MDLGMAMAALQAEPVWLDRRVAELRGAFMPVMVPLACLTPAQRARWLLPRADVDLAERVGSALEAGLVDQAWALVIGRPLPLVGRLDLVIGMWNARELARLGLPNQDGGVEVVGEPPRGLDKDAGLALAAVREMLGSLPWPRWSGPLLLAAGDCGARDPAPGRALVLRPALPVVRWQAPPAGVTPAEHLAARFCLLTLRLTAPPAAGWPPWLETGLMEVAKAKARGDGPSPLRMLAIRQRAGKDAIARLFAAPAPDAQLALAVCAPLVHTRRRPLLPNFLDLLRHDAGTEGALRLAYSLTIDQLIEER